jgi:phenylalanyl-tRNA synthetase alpha subunit
MGLAIEIIDNFENILESVKKKVKPGKHKDKVLDKLLKKTGGSYNKIKSALQSKIDRFKKAKTKHLENKKALKHLERLKKQNKIKRIRSDSERRAMFAAIHASKKSK